MGELPRKRVRAAWRNSMPLVLALSSWYVTAVAMENGVGFGAAMAAGALAALIVGAADLLAYRLYLRRLVDQARRARLVALTPTREEA